MKACIDDRQAALHVSGKASVRALAGIGSSEWTPRLVYPTAAETAAHRACIEKLFSQPSEVH